MRRRQRTHETEQRVMKSPRMVHEPRHHVTCNKQRTDLILHHSSPDQLRVEITVQMCSVKYEWSEETTKLDYIPEQFRTAIDSGCIEMSTIIILMLEINQGKHTLVMDNVTGSYVGMKLQSRWPTRPSKPAWNVVPTRSNGDKRKIND